MKRVNRFRTICEVLREINDLVQSDSEKDKKIRELLNEAFNMAKRIVYKLYEYNREACKGFWKKNPRKARKIEEELRRGIDYKPLKYIKGENDSADDSSSSSSF